jgi:flagellar basal-body rod modification protein FlgD
MTTVTQPLSQVLNPSTAPSTSTPASTQQTITGAQQSLAGDQQTFLKLLTTQLQNQDPLSPLDTNQFTQQLVAMTGVQQQIVSNQLLQQLVNGQSSNLGDPVGLIGKTVTANTAQATLQGGTASWFYSLAAPAQQAQLQVTNSLGQVVWQQTTGPLTAGQQSLTWNGKDMNGNQLTDGGTYTLSVSATDSNGGTVASTIYQRGLASSVQQSNGQNFVTINGVPVPTSSVTAVGAAGS